MSWWWLVTLFYVQNAFNIIQADEENIKYPNIVFISKFVQFVIMIDELLISLYSC